MKNKQVLLSLAAAALLYILWANEQKPEPQCYRWLGEIVCVQE